MTESQLEILRMIEEEIDRLLIWEEVERRVEEELLALGE